MSIEQLTQLFGWMTLINLGLMLLTLVAVVLMKKLAITVHQRLFGLSKAELSHAYFTYLARFKLLVIVFNLTPYLALLLMA